MSIQQVVVNFSAQSFLAEYLLNSVSFNNTNKFKENEFLNFLRPRLMISAWQVEMVQVPCAILCCYGTSVHSFLHWWSRTATSLYSMRSISTTFSPCSASFTLESKNTFHSISMQFTKNVYFVLEYYTLFYKKMFYKKVRLKLVQIRPIFFITILAESWHSK